MKIPIISRIAGLPRRTRWIVISGIVLCGIELILALALSASWVKDAPRLLAFADWVKHFAPVVGNFNQVARYPEGLRVFLAITICLIPLKAFLCYVYLYVTYNPQEEAKTPLSFWMKLLAIFATYILLSGTLNFEDTRYGGTRGLNAFIASGLRSGDFWLWFSWSIIQLGFVSWFIAVMLLLFWKKCVFLFHSLKRAQNG